jgi:hypothetical protein
MSLQRFFRRSLGIPVSYRRSIAMKEKCIHQWRDWLLRHIGEGKYELIQKNDSSVHIIMAKNDIDAENKGRDIIKNAETKQPVSCQAGLSSDNLQEAQVAKS